MLSKPLESFVYFDLNNFIFDNKLITTFPHMDLEYLTFLEVQLLFFIRLEFSTTLMKNLTNAKIRESANVRNVH